MKNETKRSRRGKSNKLVNNNPTFLASPILIHSLMYLDIGRVSGTREMSVNFFGFLPPIQILENGSDVI